MKIDVEFDPDEVAKRDDDLISSHSSQDGQKRQRKSHSKEKSQGSNKSTESTKATTSGNPTITRKSKSNKTFGNSTDVMVKRWIKSIAKTTPEVDMMDITQVIMSPKASSRQFAPQYSQAAYESMIE